MIAAIAALLLAAEPQAATPVPHPAEAVVASAIFSKDKWDKALEVMIPGLARMMEDQMRAGGVRFKKPSEQFVREVLLAEVLTYDEMVRFLVTTLRKRLKPEELAQAAAFFSSPAGRAFQELVDRSDVEMQAYLQERSALIGGVVQRRAAEFFEPIPQ